MNLLEKLNHVVARHDELRQILATQNNMDSKEFQRISKEFSELVGIVEIVYEFREMETEAQDLAEMIADPGTDIEMRAKSSATSSISSGFELILEKIDQS